MWKIYFALRRFLNKLGFRVESKLTFDNVFNRKSTTPTERQYKQMLSGCIMLSRLVKLPSAEGLDVDNMNRDEAFDAFHLLMKNIIMDFARYHSSSFEETFRMVMNPHHQRLYINAKVQETATQILEILNVDEVMEKLETYDEDKDVDKIYAVNEIMSYALDIAKAVKYITDDIRQYNNLLDTKEGKWEHFCYSFTTKYPIDYLNHLYRLVESKGDERWLDNEEIINQPSFKEMITIVKQLNRIVL